MTDLSMMLLVYSAILIIFGRINPIEFYKTLIPTLIMSVPTMSSNVMIPHTMQTCKKLGVSEKVYSFSIPLGATVNMDASCIYMTLSVLFAMKCFDVPIDMETLLPVLFMLFVMSIGSPGVSGGSLAMMAILLPMLDIPATFVTFLTVAYSATAYILTPCNIAGDVVVTTVMAKRAGLYSKED